MQMPEWKGRTANVWRERTRMTTSTTLPSAMTPKMAIMAQYSCRVLLDSTAGLTHSLCPMMGLACPGHLLHVPAPGEENE
jgi:hypothetical protein